MPDPYQELDVFGRPKSRVDGVPYVAFDDDLVALQNYVLNLRAKEEAIESGARTPRRVKEIVREGGRLPGYVHPYEPGYVVQEQERLRDETDPVQFLPIVRQGVENVRAIYNEGPETPEYIDAKLFGQRAPQYLNTLGSQVRKGGPGFEARFGEWQDPWIVGGDPALRGSLAGRTQMWPEKMARSGVSLPGDVMSGRVMTGPGLRATDFSDIPGAPNPLAPLIERTQDLAGMAMGGSIPELAARGVDRNALGSGFVPKEKIVDAAIQTDKGVFRGSTHATATVRAEEAGVNINELNLDNADGFITSTGRFVSREEAAKIADEAGQRTSNTPRLESGQVTYPFEKDLTQGSFGGNVPPSAARNIGRETMPEILARQRASEGYEAAIRDPETKKLYTGMWHEEVLDKIAKDKGVPKDQLPTNLVKGYVNDRGRFLTEEAVERMSQNKSKTAMFRADDEVGAAVAAMHATEGKAPELKVGQANLPAVVPQGGLPAPGTALNPISNRRGFLRGARDLMAAASNANKIVGMAEKLGQTPIPKNPKVPLKEIWKHEDIGNERLNIDEETWKEHIDDAHQMWAEDFEAEKGKPPTVKQEEKQRAFLEKDVRENPDDYFDLQDYYEEPEGGGTQFSHHQLPGATNYREHLMQMPEQTIQAKQYKLLNQDGALMQMGPDRPAPHEIKPGWRVEEVTKGFQQTSEHPFYGDWDEPDVIGHSRVNDRQIPGVGKALHIEEIGSQLHEKGAKSGYRPEKGLPKGFTINEKPLDPESWVVKSSPGMKGDYWVETPEGKYTTSRSYVSREQAINTAREHMVPDLPFKKTYVDLAVNRMLHEAAMQGYDAVSWTPHELQKAYWSNTSNKEILPRIEALTKKYGGKIEKHAIDAEKADNFDKWAKMSADERQKAGVQDRYEKLIDEGYDRGGGRDQIHVLKLTPEMKRIFGHDDFSFFPKQEAGAGFKLRSDSEAGAAIGALRHAIKPPTLAEATAYAQEMAGGALDWKRHTPEAQQEWLRRAYDQIVKQRTRDADAVKAPTFYSGLARTIERAPFETATPSQWMKHLRDTVGARQAEEFEHVGLEDRLGPLAEVKAPVERKAQAALETWKAANKGQRPPKELTDAASNENKRIVEQRLAEKGNEKPLTKAELLAHVAGNQPKFKEIVKNKGADDEEAAIHERAQEIMSHEHPDLTPQHAEYFDHFADATNRAEDEMISGHDKGYNERTKYSDYQLPGGTNYREHLMTMPATEITKEGWKRIKEIDNKMNDLNYQRGRIGSRPTIESELKQLQTERDTLTGASKAGSEHHSSHWDEPNVIVHTRMNDRNLEQPGFVVQNLQSGNKSQVFGTREEAQQFLRGLPKTIMADIRDGNKTLKSLHAEEFQSDLHQEGRKKGYGKRDVSKWTATSEDKPREWGPVGTYKKWTVKDENGNIVGVLDKNDKPTASDVIKEIASGMPPAVPNFPFKKSWPDLAIKRWLREAADNDYDAVSWTPGEAQRDRFQLAHHLEELGYEKHPNGTYTLAGQRRGGGRIDINRSLPIKEADLPQHVGEAVAERIKKGEGKRDQTDSFTTLSNADLKVGGEGLVSFYDKTVKGKVEALVEKFGGKVEKHTGNKRAKEIDERLKELDKAELSTDPRVQRQSDVQRMNEIFKLRNERRALSSPDDVWSVKLTPEMKRAIRSEGFPLFTAGPVMTPVDHDPFDKKQKPKPKLEPVEHDPFAQPTPDLGGTLNKLISTAGGYRPRPRPIQNGFGRRQ